MLLHAHRLGYSIEVYTTFVGVKLDNIDLIKDLPYRKLEVHLPDGEGLTKLPIYAEHLAKISKISTSGIDGLNFMTIGTLHSEVKKSGDCMSTSIALSVGPGMSPAYLEFRLKRG